MRMMKASIGPFSAMSWGRREMVEARSVAGRTEKVWVLLKVER
jgi:hypothetical protein